MTPMQTSEITTAAERLATLIRELCTQRNMVEAEIAELTTENDNIVHRMEYPDCKYKERARLATQLSKIRKYRRTLKDWLKANEPFFKYIGSEDGARAQKMVSNLVGIGRRVGTDVRGGYAVGYQNRPGV